MFIQDLYQGIIKAVVFRFIISTIGTYFGFQVSKGAEGVGKGTNLAVVWGMISVLIIDYFNIFSSKGSLVQNPNELEPAISFKDVVKTFGTHTVLNNLNFNIPKGKITTILGFSGAGKSTLMKHILGLLQPTVGEVVVLGKNLRDMSKVELREFRQNFGMLFQYAALFDFLTSVQNVEFPLREFTKMSKFERIERSRKLLESVNLIPESFDKLPSELSGGMRKRVGTCSRISPDPKGYAL